MTLHPMLRRIPLVFSPQPESGFTVTSPIALRKRSNDLHRDSATASSRATSQGLRICSGRTATLPEVTLMAERQTSGSCWRGRS